MLTFLELYQTLLSFVFFKLFTDVGLVYPPPLDIKKDEGAAGLNAFELAPATRQAPPAPTKTTVVEGRQITSKAVRQTIKSLTRAADVDSADVEMSNPEPTAEDADEEFVAHPSTSDKTATAAELPTLQSISTLPQTLSTSLFSSCVFFLSRETPRSVFEFLVRCFGGRIGWTSSAGSGSPFDETDPSITHIIIDRPAVEKEETPEQRELRLRRKYVQPQWIVDCINAGKLLLEEPYAQGKTLPPHLSPFGEYEGAYIPEAAAATEEAMDEEADSEVEEDEEEAEDEEDEEEALDSKVDRAVADATEDPAALRAAELAAEAAGVDFGTFEAKVKKASKKLGKSAPKTKDDAEGDMNKMMMSNKQRKLYEKMKYSNKKKESEVSNRTKSMITSNAHFSSSASNWKHGKRRSKSRSGSRRALKPCFLHLYRCFLC